MNDSFSSRLKEARKAAGYKTADDAIARFGFKRDTYKSHEAGARNPIQSTKGYYAKKYNVKPEWLFFGSGEMNDEKKETLKEVAFLTPSIDGNDPLAVEFSIKKKIKTLGISEKMSLFTWLEIELKKTTLPKQSEHGKSQRSKRT